MSFFEKFKSFSLCVSCEYNMKFVHFYIIFFSVHICNLESIHVLNEELVFALFLMIGDLFHCMFVVDNFLVLQRKNSISNEVSLLRIAWVFRKSWCSFVQIYRHVVHQIHIYIFTMLPRHFKTSSIICW